MKRLIGASLALALLATACTKVSQTGEPGGRVNSFTQPHVLRYADAGDVNTLNPHLGQFTPLLYLSRMTMAWLIRWDQNNNPIPELATEVPTQANGGVSKDGLTITYHLRHGVKWSDGAPFTADDVVFSTKVVLNPANNEVSREGWDQITKIDEPDKYTVVYHLKKPYSPFIEVFFSTAGANPCILPKHLLAKYPNINNVPYNSLPVGIGPFKYERWDRSQQVVLVANPLYWRGRPKLDKVIYKIIPDRNTLLSQFQAKELDLWPLVPGNYLDRMKQLEPYAVMQQPGYFWNHLDFNLTNPALQDPAVRHAMLYALDRQEIIDKIGHGLGTVSDSPTPVDAPYTVKLPTTPFDIGKANALLDKAGWVKGGDGVRAKNGTRLVFRFAVPSGLQDQDNMIELMRANYQKIGVQLEVRHYPSALFFAPLQEGGIVYDAKKWDLILFAWENDGIGDFSQIYSCNGFPPAGQNDPRWCNKKAQAAMDALYGHYNQADRNKDVTAFVHAFAEDLPVIVTSQRVDVYAYNKDLKNFKPNAITAFDNMMDVDI
ncbi:MAG TPA: peptide ABC transporter substrate-binding protein [Candidatus Aquilonibacter sp.]|nr:peptide ABC transporter substrate-binding protein [Candidatus Aquilonibacter sp.]